MHISATYPGKKKREEQELPGHRMSDFTFQEMEMDDAWYGRGRITPLTC